MKFIKDMNNQRIDAAMMRACPMVFGFGPDDLERLSRLETTTGTEIVVAQDCPDMIALPSAAVVINTPAATPDILEFLDGYFEGGGSGLYFLAHREKDDWRLIPYDRPQHAVPLSLSTLMKLIGCRSTAN